MKNAETKDRIKKALEVREMRQSELVEKTGIDKGQMSSYLAGRYKPKQKNLSLIAEALNVDEAWLMGYDVPMERSSDLGFTTSVSYDATNWMKHTANEHRLLTHKNILTYFCT